MKYILSLVMLCACSTPAEVIKEIPKQIQTKNVLTWEQNQPERAEWTSKLIAELAPQIAEFDKATDIMSIRPDWQILNKDQKTLVIAQFFCSMAFFESGWRQDVYSVDVGVTDNHDTWSVGLWQMSVTDQKNHKLPFNYSFADLKNMQPNARLAIAVMVHQIQRRGKILIKKGEPGVYWSTINPGNKHDKSLQIIEQVKAVRF